MTDAQLQFYADWVMWIGILLIVVFLPPVHWFLTSRLPTSDSRSSAPIPTPESSPPVPASTPPPLHEDPTTDLVSAQLGVTHAEFMCFLQKTIDGVESGALTVKICDAYWSERTTQRDGVLHVEIGTVSPMKFRVGVNASVEYRETWVDVRCSSFDACIQFYNKTAVADKERALYAALCTLLVQKCIALRDPATWGVMYETHHQLRATPMFKASGCCSQEKAP